MFDEPGAIATVRVSVAGDGTQGNGHSAGPFLPAGTNSIVVLFSDASNLVAGDTNGTTDVFVAGTGQ